MNNIIKYRWWIIGISIGLTIIFSLQLKDIRIDADMRHYFPPEMESMINTNRIEDVFGAQDIILLLFLCDDALASATLERVEKVENEIKRIPEVSRTTSLFGSNHIHGEEGVMYVDPSVAKIPGSFEEREVLRDQIMANNLVYGVVVADDFSSSAIIITAEKGCDEVELLANIENIIDEHPGSEDVLLGGMPSLRYVITEHIKRDGFILIPLALILMLLFLYYVFKEWGGVFLPFLVVVLSTMLAVSFIPLFNWKFSIISLLAPIMLIAMANDYGIHIFAKYQELNANDQDTDMPGFAKIIFRKLSVPISLAALTTIAGISSLLVHQMIPARQMAVIAGLGILFAIFFSLVLMSAIMSTMKKTAPRPLYSHQKNGKKQFLHRYGNFVVTRSRTILLCTLIVTLVVSCGILNLRVDSNEENFFSERQKIRQASNIINDKYGGSHSVSVMFHGDMMDPVVLERIDYYASELEKLEQVDVTTGFPDVIKEISKALNDEDSGLYDKIPLSRDGVAQYMMIYSMSSDPSELDQIIDFNRTYSHLIVRINNSGNKAIKEVVAEIRKLTELDESVVAIGGYGYVMTQFADFVVKGQFLSLAIALIVIFSLLGLIFRSFIAGILGIIPLVISVLLLFGIMGFTNIPLDVATALLSSLMIGVGVDYTIHFFWRYREEFRKHSDKAKAVKITIENTGRGIIFNALSVMVGFSVLMLSSFTPIRFFGILVVITIFSCMMGAMLIIPSIIMNKSIRFLEE